MEASYYWLISITTEAITVALVKRAESDTLLALGPETEWLSDNPDSFLHSVDVSLSEAAEKAALAPELEPEQSAFILPPKWIGNDGKIFPEYLKLLENLCHSLKLKPLGFISNDEAFIESLNRQDAFPPSFILLYLGKKEFSISLVYLGEVKKRFHQSLNADFTPQDLENALVTIRLDSALPPQILLFGHLSPTIIDDLSNYAWVGKKNIETFLHLPDVKAYQSDELFNLYCQTVSSQISPTLPKNNLPEEKNDTPVPSPVEEEITETNEVAESKEADIPPLAESEVTAKDLGFSQITDSDSIVLPPPADTISPPPSSPHLALHLPHISLPHFSLTNFHFQPPKLHLNYKWLFPLALSPFLLLIPYFLIKAEVTLNLNPIEINRDFNLTLDSTTTTASATVIPVLKKSFNLNFTDSLATTGEKETGEKAKGEITVYNKLDKIQNIPKGTILSDSAGKKYEFLTSVQVPASTFNLAAGTITMGQTKATAIASDIGPEFNLAKDSILNFKDNANILAKVNESLTGGTRRQIRVVSADDKNKLAAQVTNSLNDRISEKINSDSSLTALIPGTAYTEKKQLDYNREVGEEADTLTVNVSLTSSLLQLDPNQKENILKTLLANDQQFLQSTASPSDFSFSFTATQTTAQKSVGKLTVTGKTLPKLDTDKLRRLLAGKSLSAALKIAESQPRVYNRHIEISPTIFSFLKRLPPSGDRITIIEKF